MIQYATNLKAGTAVVLAGLLLSAAPAQADTVELANGDTLTGTVVEQTDAGVTFEHAALGRIELDKERIAAVTIDPPAEQAPEPAPEPEPEPEPAPVPTVDPVAAQ